MDNWRTRAVNVRRGWEERQDTLTIMRLNFIWGGTSRRVQGSWLLQTMDVAFNQQGVEAIKQPFPASSTIKRLVQDNKRSFFRQILGQMRCECCGLNTPESSSYVNFRFLR